MENILAIDIGGTHQRFSCVDSQGKILEKITYPSYGGISSELFFQSLEYRISDHLKKNSCKGVALALPVVLEEQTGRVKDAPNLSFLVGQNLKESLSFLSVPWVVENDEKE